MKIGRLIRQRVKKKYSAGPLMLELEPRVLLSADLPGGLAGDDALHDSVIPTTEPAVLADNEGMSPMDVAASATQTLRLVVPIEKRDTSETESAATQTHELVIVNLNTPDYEVIVDDLVTDRGDGRQFEVVILDTDRGGIEQLSALLGERTDLDAVHIISHGDDGSISLGNELLDLDALIANSKSIQGWGDAFTDDGDLLIYGCDLAAGADGRAFIDVLGRLTGADIAASTDLTGDAALGGDWDLEYRQGVIEADVAVSAEAQSQWAHTLAVTEDLTSGGQSGGADITVTHTTSGTGRLMLVGVTLNHNGSNSVQSVQWNNTDLTLFDTVENGDARVEIWSMVAPETGTFDVDVVFNRTPDGATVAVTTFNGVDQSTPLGTFGSNTGNSGSGSANISSAAGELVYAVIAVDDATDYNLDTGGQNELFDLYGQEISGGGITEAGAPSVPVSWTWSGSDVWAVGGVSIRPFDVTTSLVVTTTGDVNDGDTSSIAALNASKGADGFISLREALIAANNSTEDGYISFDISAPLVGGMHTFDIGAGGLPQINDTVTIDGTTDSDYAGDPVIRIDGNSAGAGIDGLSFGSGADGSSVRGIMITRFSDAGIQVNSGADGISITNSWIGTTGTGSTGVGNGGNGINVQGDNTIIGGTGANDGNVITNNGNEGINLSSALGTIIQGNIIGLDPDGSTGSGNNDVGIALLSGSDNTVIGGTTVAARNVISMNVEGIEINTDDNIVQGNYIGTDITGLLDRGNGDGIQINSSTGNLIGGTATDAGNLIAFNSGDGVDVSSGTGSTVLGNVIHSNTSQAIDLGDDGVTNNDPDDADIGANNLQNFPVITSAELGGTDLTLGGTLDTDGITTQYRIEFFGNAVGTQDPTNGEARVYLGTTTVTTDGSGDATFSNVVLSGVTLAVGDFVTATATRITDPGQVGLDDQLAYGSSSEFAVNVVIAAAPAPVVTVDPLSTTDTTPQLTGTVSNPSALIVVTAGGQTWQATNNGDGTWTLPNNSFNPALADGTYDVAVSAVGLWTTDTVRDNFSSVSYSNNDGTVSWAGSWVENDDDGGGASSGLIRVTGNQLRIRAEKDDDWIRREVDLSAATTATLTFDFDSQLSGSDRIRLEVYDGSSYTTLKTYTSSSGTGSETFDITNYIASNTRIRFYVENDDDDEYLYIDNVEISYDVWTGSTGTDATTNELFIDSTPPSVTVTPLTTNDTTPIVTGTFDSADSASLSVTVDGVTYVLGTDAELTNVVDAWTLDLSAITPLAEGTYQVIATATDAVGNVGNDPTTNELVIDTTDPVVTVDALTTNDTTPQLTGTVDDPAATISVTVDGNGYVATNNGDGTWTLADNAISPALAEGTYEVAVSATDAAGNTGNDGTTLELVIDTTPPSAPVVNPLTTNDNTPILTGTYDSADSAGLSVTVDGTTYVLGTDAELTNVVDAWTLDLSAIPPLGDGTYEVTATATDAATNQATDVSSNELVIDTVGPTVTVTPLITNDTTPIVTGSFDSADSASLSVEVNSVTYVLGTDAELTNVVDAWTLDLSAITPLAEGTYQVIATATDALGNPTIDSSSNELVIDTTSPVVTVDALTTNDTTPQLTGTVDDPAATISVTVDGNGYVATNNGDGTWTLADNAISPALAEGTYEVAVSATDLAGNPPGTDGTTLELVIDTTPPSAPVVYSLITIDSTPIVTGRYDSADSAGLSVTVDGTTYVLGTDAELTNSGDDWTLDLSAITPLAAGTYEVTATATDAATNQATDASSNELEIIATNTSFQEGTNSYNGTEDTWLEEGDPAQGHGSDSELEVDLSSGGGETQSLIRFDSIFGTGPGQIPPGSTINSASLIIEITGNSDPAANITLHTVLVNWDESSTWNLMTGGLQRDGVEVTIAADATVSNPQNTGANTITGLAATVQAWLDGGATNYGWAIFNDDTDGFDFASSEYGTVNQRPQLVVDFTPPPINNVPTAQNNTVVTVQDTDYTFTVADFLFNDVDGDSLTKVQITGLESVGALQLSGADVALNDEILVADITAGNLKFVPVPGQTGTGYDSFEFRVNDGTGYSAPVGMTTIMNSTFDADAEGFTYADDPFVVPSTSNPGFADGVYDAAGGLSGGGLRVDLAGAVTTGPVSGGWSDTFNLAQAETVTVSLQYRMVMSEMYEANEFGEIFLEVDGILYGSDTNNSLLHNVGDGNGGAVYDSGWLFATFDIALGAGAHTILVGAHNNDSTAADEYVTAYFDDIQVTGPGADYTMTVDVNTLSNVLPVAADDPVIYSNYVNSLSPLGYWRLGESSGTTVYDETGTNNGTYINGPSLGQGGALADEPANTAVAFDGTVNDDTGDYIEIADDPSYFVDEGAIQLWFNTADVTQDAYLFSKDAVGTVSGGHAQVGVNAASHVTVRLQDTGTSYTGESTTALTANEWHHVVFTFGSGGMQLYVDGQLVDTDAYTGGLDDISSGGTGNVEPIVIGASSANSVPGTANPTDMHFDGRIDEVAMFGAQLTAEQIRELYGAALQNYTIYQDTTLNATAAGGVLATDYDANDDPLTAVLVTGPSNAQSFTLNADGSFDYTPTAGFSGTDTFTYQANDGTGNSNVATVTITVDAVVTANAVWISTDSDSAAPGADGLPTGWRQGEALEFGGVDLAFGPATDGDFSSVIDFDTFSLGGDPTDIAALHYVGTNLTVGGGANTFDLQRGDVLVSFNQAETILGAYTVSASDETFDATDLMAFRPDTPGDYTSGTFYLLLDDVVTTNLRGITLVEQDTTVGDANLTAGSFLLTRDTLPFEDVYLFDPTGVGAGTTTGTTTTLIDGSALNIDALPSSELRGLELIERTTSIGGVILDAGTLLFSLRYDDPAVGGNNLATTQQDIFAVTVTKTGVGTTAGIASMFLQGADVGLDGVGGVENIYAIAMIPDLANSPPTAANNTVVTLEDTNYTFTVADFNFSDPDAGDTLQFVQITSLETVGALQLSGVDVVLNQVIAVADIIAGNLTFTPVPDANGVGYDSFDFKVSDGFAQTTGTVLNSFIPSGPAGVSGNTDLAFDGTNIWLSHNTTDTIYELDAAGNILSSFAAPSTHPAGLTFDGTNLWLVDRSSDVIYELDTAGNILSSFAAPNTSPSGLTFDGTNLWMVDNSADMIYEIDTSGNPLSSFATPGGSARGLTWDGTSLWLADDADQLIYELNTSGAVLSSFAAPDTGAAGITFDGTDFWHADSNTQDIFQLAGPNSVTYSAAAYTMTVDVTPDNDAPTAADNTVVTLEDTAYVFTAADFNFSDIDTGDTLQHVQITSLETAGALQLSGVDVVLNQIIDVADITAGNLTFTPAQDQNGVAYDSFGFKVSDGVAQPVGTVLNTFTPPDVGSMSGLAFDGPNIWLSDQNGNTIYELDQTGGIVSSFAGPASDPAGLTFDGTNLWLVDRATDMIYELDTSGNVLSSFATPGNDPRGLTFDGTNLWLVEGQNTEIYELTTAGAVVSNFNWPSGQLRDITWNGTSLWLVDRDDQVVRELNTTGTELSTFALPDTGGAGITFDGLNFWHADTNTNDMYQLAGPNGTAYSAAAYTMTVDVTPDSDAPTAADNTVVTLEDNDHVFTVADFNFSDPDTGDTLQFVQITSLETVGELKLSGVDVVLNQIISVADIIAGNLTFTPAPDANGVGYDSFGFKVGDGTSNTGSVLSSFSPSGPASVTGNSGLAFDGTNFWISANNTDTIYELDNAGNVLSSFLGPGTNPNGLTFDGTNLWLADRSTDTIYELDTAGNILSSFSTSAFGSGRPGGLAFDGTNLWLVDNADDLIYEVDTAGNLLSSIPTPGGDARGLTWDGTSLWVTDDVDGLVYELNPADGAVLSSFATPNSGAAGITFDGTDFWHANNGPDTIYQLAGPNSTLYSALAYTMTIDVTAVPDVTVDTLTTNNTSPQLTGTVDDPAATINVNVDGNNYAAVNNGDGTWTLAAGSIAPALTDGTYDVAVSATNGEVGTDSTTNELVIDTTGPTVTVTPLTTNDPTPILSGTFDSADSASLTVEVNSVVYTLGSSPELTNVLDAWTLDLSAIAPLADNTYQVIAIATDALGNPTTDGTTDELVIDTTGPTVTVTPLTTNDPTPILSGTFDSADSASLTVEVNSVVYTLGSSPELTNVLDAWTLDLSAIAPLADNTYQVIAIATDALGNPTTDGTTDELVIDTTGPSAPVVNPLATSDTTPILTGTFDAADSAGLSVAVNGVTYVLGVDAELNTSGNNWTLDLSAIAPLVIGTYPVTAIASDSVGNLSIDATTDELVIVVNTAPVAVDDNITVTEDVAYIAVAGVNDLLLNDSDPDGDPLSVDTTPVAAPTQGSVILNADGTFTYVPNANFNGADAFTYRIMDGNGGIAQATVLITVDPVDDAPIVTADSYNLTEDNVLASSPANAVLANDVEVDGEAMIVNTVPVSNPSNGVLILNSDGTFAYTPDANFNGVDGFTYQVADSNGTVSQGNVTITIAAADDPPVGVGDNITADGGIASVLAHSALTANDANVDGDGLSITNFTQPSNGTVFDNGDGTFTYTPTSGFSGVDSFCLYPG